MMSFAEFIVEEEQFLTEIFDKVPTYVRDSETEKFAKKMVPSSVTNVEMHKVDGMSDSHRVMHFRNGNNENEFHIIDLNGNHGRLDSNSVDHSNAASAYSHIIHKTKQGLDNGISTRFQAKDPRQYDLYHKAASRLVKHHSTPSEIFSLGTQPTVQGFSAKTFTIEPK